MERDERSTEPLPETERGDELLRRLGRWARERRRDADGDPTVPDTDGALDELPDGVLGDPRLDALVEGRLDTAGLRRLEAETRSSDDARLAVDLHRPLGDDFRAAMTRALGESMAAPEPRREPQAAPAGPAVPSVGGRFRRRVAVWAGALAASLVLAVVGGRWALDPPPAPEPLGAYALEWSGGLADQRTGEAARGVPRWGVGAELELVARPAAAVPGPVHAHAWMARPGEVRPWPGEAPRTASSGAVLLRGRLPADADLVPGPWTILLWLGRSPTPPTPQDVQLFERQQRPPEGWLVLRQPVVVEAR